ncbi:uncharacterized protein LOC141822969 [Curcuma longa]|uniref:uncharacterized protein LOC141822969 n=1 Tax=Curcuma longa TaxID=136217 RepID=UPI003D9E7AA9
MEINLLIDAKKERVILAESNSDFIDVLFSFLTLPLGTIVRILEKQSFLGCMDRLYESVQKLDIDYFSTEACKTMLLAPRSLSDLRCEDLKLRPNDSYPRSIYICETPDCFYQHCFALGIKACSREPRTVCLCGHTMTHYYSLIDRIACDFLVEKEKDIVKQKKEENGVFVVKRGTFLVTDDLYVMQSSTNNTLIEMKKYGIENCDSGLEQRKVTLERSTMKHVVSAAIAIKGLGGLFYSSSAVLLERIFWSLLYLTFVTPILFDFYNYDIQNPEFVELFAKFTQNLALSGA